MYAKKPLHLMSDIVVYCENKSDIALQENECFQEALRSTQRKLLKVNRDKSFLLDRLLQYEKVDASFSESDETESSEEEVIRLDNPKK
jgi:INO80 complex subunit E